MLVLNRNIIKHKFQNPVIILMVFGFILTLIINSCDYDFIPPPPPPPPPPKATSTLEVQYVSTPPTSLSNRYWSKTADFLEVQIGDTGSSGLLYSDGLLNMTGTYNGKTDFNNGEDPGLILKAAFDDNMIYILVEWTDSDINISSQTLVWDGNTDPLKTDSSKGWTSQRNSDKLAFAFEIDPVSSSYGSFSTVGCAASCHYNGNSYEMKPLTGKTDIWKWDLALSEPLGYSFDMVSDEINGLNFDAGQQIVQRNSAGTDNRSAPLYEWDGSIQDYTRPDGKKTILDPAFFLLNKTDFTGEVLKGEVHYLDNDYGCFHCHGEKGQGSGDFGDGSPFNNSSINRIYSRSGFENFASSSTTHPDGAGYYNHFTASEKTDIIARIRSFFGLPGYYLTTPDGSNADITSTSNVSLTKVSTGGTHIQYKVLLVRKLLTGNSDDIQFDLSISKTYKFGIALMDNDGKNHIGSIIETLTFK